MLDWVVERLTHNKQAPPAPGRIPGSTSGPKKSQRAQNELYHHPSWSPRNLSACVVISVRPCMRFIIAPAVCLRLTCLPEGCVKCVWPKKPPCGCVPLCPRWTSPCQHAPSASVLTLLLARSPDEGGSSKNNRAFSRTRSHKKNASPLTHSSHWLSSHLFARQHAATVEGDETGEEAGDECRWLRAASMGLITPNNDNSSNYLREMRRVMGVMMGMVMGMLPSTSRIRWVTLSFFFLRLKG